MPPTGVPHTRGPAHIRGFGSWQMQGVADENFAPTLLDDFNRADGAVGSNWTQLFDFGFPLTISSNTILGVTGDNSGGWNVTQFGPDAEAAVTVVSTVAGFQVIPFLRVSQLPVTNGAGTYYALVATATGTNIVGATAGYSTQTTLATSTVVVSAGDQILFRAVGTQLTGYIKRTGATLWTPIVSAIDSSVTAAGYSGLYVFNAAVVDDFRSDSVNVTNQTVSPPAATASASAPLPTVQLQVAPAAATATASAPTPAVQLQVAPAAATASASAPTPTVQLQVAPAVATAGASGPGPVMPIVVPVSTASANSPPATPQLQVAPPAATASASAPPPTLKLQAAPPAATASASAPTPAAALKVSPPAATAAASAPIPTPQDLDAPPAATAAASAPTPGVDVKVAPTAATASASAPIPGVALRVSPASATASASAPTPTVTGSTANQTVSPPAATASASAPTPTPALQLSPPAATASASAPGPADGDSVLVPVATAAASALVPTVTTAAAGTVNAPVATASASALTPKIHHIFFDIAELWHHHETGLGEYVIAPGLSLNTSELFNQRYRDNSKPFPVTGDPTLTVDLEKLWDQKYRDTSVPFPVDQL